MLEPSDARATKPLLQSNMILIGKNGKRDREYCRECRAFHSKEQCPRVQRGRRLRNYKRGNQSDLFHQAFAFQQAMEASRKERAV
jgi:hypothetical protein